MGLLETIGLWLINEAKATALGTDIFLDYTPPDGNCITLYEYGDTPQTLQVNALHRGIQVQVRNTSSSTAKQFSWELYKLFKEHQDEDARINFTPSSWGQVLLRTAPMKLKVDDKNQIYWTFNLGITTNILG